MVISFISGYASVSDGLFFTEKIKSSLFSLAIFLCIGSAIALTIFYSAWHILGVIGTYVAASFLGVLVWMEIIRKGPPA